MVDIDKHNPGDDGAERASESFSRRTLLARAALGAGAVVAAGALPGAALAKRTIKVGGKDFTEDQLIAHMYSLLLQQAGIPVSEHFNLPTSIAHSSLVRGDIDLYPEYTGTGLEVILKQSNVKHDAATYYHKVAQGYQKRFHLTWLQPSPMNDTQGLATTQAISKKYGLKTISDMVKHASKLRFIANSEFLSRPDGLPGLKKTYGDFSFSSTVQVAGAGSLRYAALMQGRGDVVVAFTTDGLIAGDHLVVLRDNKGYAPPDQVAPVVRDDALKAYPQMRSILNKLAPKITSAAIQQLNYQVDGQHQDMDTVAKAFLHKQGLLRG